MASTSTGKKDKNRDLKKGKEKIHTEPTGAPVQEPVEKKAVRKKTKTKPLEKITEKKAPEQQRFTVGINVDKSATDTDEEEDTAENVIDAAKIKEEDDDEEKPKRKKLSSDRASRLTKDVEKRKELQDQKEKEIEEKERGGQSERIDHEEMDWDRFHLNETVPVTEEQRRVIEVAEDEPMDPCTQNN